MHVPDLATRQLNCKEVRLPPWQRHPLQVSRQQANTKQAQRRTEPGIWKMSRQSRSLGLAVAFIMGNVCALNLLPAAHSITGHVIHIAQAQYLIMIVWHAAERMKPLLT